ncbi:DUF4145 domain-containing protein [Pantoea dispersa]
MSRTVWDEPKLKILDNIMQSIECHQCNSETNHKVLTNAVFSVSYYTDDEYDNSMDASTRIEIIQCQGCMSPSVRFSSWDSEAVDYHSGGVDPIITYDFYPKRKQLVVFDKSYELPSALQDLYSETINAINNGSPTIAGIGIRGLIETICREENIAGDNLEKKIDNLFNGGKISNDSKAILHSLRKIYNKSAHESFKPSKEQLYVSLEIIELLMKQLYIHSPLAKKHFTQQ